MSDSVLDRLVDEVEGRRKSVDRQAAAEREERRKLGDEALGVTEADREAERERERLRALGVQFDDRRWA